MTAGSKLLLPLGLRPQRRSGKSGSCAVAVQNAGATINPPNHSSGQQFFIQKWQGRCLWYE